MDALVLVAVEAGTGVDEDCGRRLLLLGEANHSIKSTIGAALVLGHD